MLEVLFRECKKEKIEYKVVALVTTATIINHINRDLFKVKNSLKYIVILWN